MRRKWRNWRVFFLPRRLKGRWKSVHVTYRQVDTAIQQLSSDDLARLSARSEIAQKDFAAGRLGDRDLIIICLAILALILIIVAVR